MLDRLFVSNVAPIEYIGSVTKTASNAQGWDTSGESLDVISVAQTGDLVVIAFTFNGSGDFTWSWNGMTFSAIDDDTGRNICGSYVGYRFVQSGDSNPYVTGVSIGGWPNLSIVASVFRGAGSFVSSSSDRGSSGMPNAPLLTSNGALWVATGHIEDSVTDWSAPSGYELASFSNLASLNPSSTAIAYKVANLSSDNPNVFGGSGSADWAANTSAYIEA
jgi:hypothetical protein